MEGAFRELLAITVDGKVFDEDVSFEFWHELMLRDCEEVSVLLAHPKALNPNEKAYRALQRVRERWKARAVGELDGTLIRRRMI